MLQAVGLQFIVTLVAMLVILEIIMFCKVRDCIMCYSLGMREIPRWWKMFTWVEMIAPGRYRTVFYRVDN